ncbi:hypothetical protein CFP56_029738 [Quercus suber]|uniref:Uncharacterized protein n=2 Tax=Quercus suber TaxID=58331 RepID=A0AAW0LV95_QUESU
MEDGGGQIGFIISILSQAIFPFNFHTQSTPSDLLSVLGPKSQSSKIKPLVAHDLNSCLKFLVPFTPTSPKLRSRKCLTTKKDLGLAKIGASDRREVDELIWWPPEPVLELARLAVDSGGDPAAIQRALDPTMIAVPDVEGLKENRCELTRTPYGRRFISEELNFYCCPGSYHWADHIPKPLGFLSRPPLSCRRHRTTWFHAKEYPAYDKEVFPYNMGFCQKGSNVKYDDSMNLRNILWLAPLPSNSTKAWVAPGVLVVLDARPEGIIYRDLIPEYVNFARTIYEDDLGDVAVDVNYLDVGAAIPDYQIFIC